MTSGTCKGLRLGLKYRSDAAPGRPSHLFSVFFAAQNQALNSTKKYLQGRSH